MKPFFRIYQTNDPLENIFYVFYFQAVNSQCLRQQQQILDQPLLNIIPQKLTILPFSPQTIEPCSNNPCSPLNPNLPLSKQQLFVPLSPQQILPCFNAPNSTPINTNVPIGTQQLFVPFLPQQTQLCPSIEYISPPIVPNLPFSSVITPVQQPGSTIIITDSSPSACKNLAETLQLMIVCNMLQNSLGAKEIGLQMAAPVINELLTSPVLSCGCANPIIASGVLPNLISNSNFISPCDTTCSCLNPLNYL